MLFPFVFGYLSYILKKYNIVIVGIYKNRNKKYILYFSQFQ